jgi:choline dehydrogenase-like flavoprotein
VALRAPRARHHMGTTRMSRDPRHGVVDADSRVHGIENLYVAGSSVFPTSGSANPTLTIVALALRLARRIESALGA